MQKLEVPGVGTTEWRRVSPKQMWVELAGNGLSVVVLIAAGIYLQVISVPVAPWLLWLLAAIILVTAIIIVPRRIRARGYLLRQDDLLYRNGIMFQRFVAVPYGRMQLVDVHQGPIARMLGIANLSFVTAAAVSKVTIEGLPLADAERLRDHLISVAESRRAGL